MIPARNEENTIEACIASVKAAASKLRTGVEIVVVDDSSSDGTAIRAEASGARVCRTVKRGGPLAAWELGVKSSSTPYIAFVDADCTIDEEALVNLYQVIEQPEVGVVSGSAIPHVRKNGDKRYRRSRLVSGSTKFSAILLDELKSRLGDHDFIAIGRLMVIRRDAWNVTNVSLPHCDREVAACARRKGWRAVWVPEAKVRYVSSTTFSELRSDWRRTRKSRNPVAPQVFEVIPPFVLRAAARTAVRKAPLDALCWISCRIWLMVENFGRRDGKLPITWD